MTEKSLVLTADGASSIGWSTNKATLSVDYRVVAFDTQDSADPRLVDFIPVNLSGPKATTAAFNEALAKEPVTRPVSYAGIVRPDARGDIKFDDFDVVMSVDVRCSIKCMQALASGMRETRFRPARSYRRDFPRRTDRMIRERKRSCYPLGQMRAPEDVTDAVSLFLSDASGFVTGQVMYASGGMTIDRTA